MKNTNKSVTVSFDCLRDEYIAAERIYLRLSGAVNTFKIVLTAVLLALCFVLGSTFGYNNYGVVICFALTVLYGLKLDYRYFIKPAAHYRRMTSNTNHFTFTFTKDNLTFDAEKAHADFKWKMFKKLYETADFIFLAHYSKSFTVIPKYAFTEEQLDAMRAIVGEGNSTMEYVKID